MAQQASNRSKPRLPKNGAEGPRTMEFTILSWSIGHLLLGLSFSGTIAVRGDFSASSTIAVSGFTRLRSTRSHQQIVPMEGKEFNK